MKYGDKWLSLEVFVDNGMAIRENCSWQPTYWPTMFFNVIKERLQ